MIVTGLTSSAIWLIVHIDGVVAFPVPRAIRGVSDTSESHETVNRQTAVQPSEIVMRWCSRSLALDRHGPCRESGGASRVMCAGRDGLRRICSDASHGLRGFGWTTEIVRQVWPDTRPPHWRGHRFHGGLVAMSRLGSFRRHFADIRECLQGQRSDAAAFQSCSGSLTATQTSCRSFDIAVMYTCRFGEQMIRLSCHLPGVAAPPSCRILMPVMYTKE